MTQTTLEVTGLAPQKFAPGFEGFDAPEVWDTVRFESVDDPTVTERFGHPMAIRTMDSSKSARLITQSTARAPMLPSDVGQAVVSSIVSAGHEVVVKPMSPTRGGFRQAFLVPTLNKVDPITWDHGLFSRDEDETNDGLQLVVGLFFRKLRVQLRAGWFRLYCSNQLLDERMGLTVPLSRIRDLETVETWSTGAVGTAQVLAKKNRKKSDSEPLPAPAVRWAAENFISPERPAELGIVRAGIEDTLGMLAGDVLARELWALREAPTTRVEDLVNAVTNLSRPRHSWIGPDFTMPGDPSRPIVSPSTVIRYESDTVDALMQALFLGTRATGCDTHAMVEAHPFRSAN